MGTAWREREVFYADPLAKGALTMEIRPATEDHIEGIAAARLSNGPAHDDSGADAGYCRHLISDGQLMVALEAGRVLGFGGAIDVAGARLLSDLFVHRDVQGRGVGRQLLAAVMTGAEARYTFASNDPAALPLYARAGMLAWWPLLSMRGAAAALPMGGAAAVEASVADAVAYELAVTGHDRTSTYRYWAGRAQSRTVQVLRGAECIAVAAVHTGEGGTRVEHLVAQPADALAALAAVAALFESTHVHVYVPGCQRLSAALMERGFSIEETDIFMATSAEVVHPLVQVVHPGLG